MAKTQWFRTWCTLVLLGMLSACINTRTIDVHTQDPAEVEDRVVVDGQTLPLPDQSDVRSESLDGQAPMTPVARRLLASAVAKKSRGENDAAASDLERALRIEPKNALLWFHLAEVRYSQQAYSSAVQLAAKSETLAMGDQSLRRRNWVLMANAYEAMGDSLNMKKYRDRLQ